VTAILLRKASKSVPRAVFFFDVDNTLLDNDRVVSDLRKYLQREVGTKGCHQYWTIFERLRTRLGYADYLGALQRYRRSYPHDIHLLAVSSFLIDYPFAKRLFPNALQALKHAQRWGQVALLSDGDVVFQPHKIERSGLYKAVRGHALVYVHKQRELKDVTARYPAKHYVVFDDKLHILAAIKRRWRQRVTTVFVQQGHYARDPKILKHHPPADVTIRRIGDLLAYNLQTLLRSAGSSKAL
jgi:FMN phosphatase YigB (HAD superfamily)